MSVILKSIHFNKLKGLIDLDISFEGKNVTGIFGVNGCGKSTILHAIHCFFKKPGDEVISESFSTHFKTVGRMTWADTSVIAKFDVEGIEKEIEYKKDARWKPRTPSKPARYCKYIGIDSCVPSVELDAKKDNFTLPDGQHANHEADIVQAASSIMSRDYSQYLTAQTSNRKYQIVVTQSGLQYNSLTMGAGEQRLFKILEALYLLPEGSILIVDEIDLTLHTIALMKLMDIIVAKASDRSLQVVFTSHREELAKRRDINIRHLWKPAGNPQTLCLDHTSPSCLRRLTGSIEKPCEIYVEDDLAELIVRDTLKDHKFSEYVSIFRFGDSANAFSVAAGLKISNTLSNHQLILLDGDVCRTDDEKASAMQNRYSGNEVGKDEIRREACRYIKQFNLPENEHPEHFIWSLLQEKQGELADIARTITGPFNNHHRWLEEILPLQGDSKEVCYSNIIRIAKADPSWQGYIQPLQNWIIGRKHEFGIH